MLLGFKKQFVPYILDGSKTHTIRAERKLRPKVGEICHCYTGLRQKGAKLLGRWKCVRVQKIEISHSSSGVFEVRLDGELLTVDEATALMRRDGFRGYAPLAQAAEFWAGNLPFFGVIIHWDFTGPATN